MRHDIQRRSHARRRVALLAASVMVAACGGEATGPVTPCELPATSLDPAAVAQVAPADLHHAAADATERLVANVSSGAAGSSLTTSVASLDQGLSAGDTQLACRAARNAMRTLDDLPADAASAPDRSALRFVIELLTAKLGED